MLNGKNILITGGTGSFGKKFVQIVLEQYKPERLIIFSRDEYKQFVMAEKFRSHHQILRFFQAQSSYFAHGLDDAHLVGAGFGQHQVEVGLLFSSGSATARYTPTPMIPTSTGVNVFLRA